MTRNATIADDAIGQDFQPSELYFLTVFSALQCAVGTIANGMTLCVILLNERLYQMPSNLLILNLTNVDLISCVVFLPFHLHNLQKESLSRFLRFIYHTLCLFHVFSNGNAILAITVDRFIAVSYPLRYKTIVTRTRVSVAILLSWIMPVLFSIAFYISLERGTPDSSEYAFRVYIILSLIIVLVFYFLVYRAARRQRSRIKADRPSLSSTCAEAGPARMLWARSLVWKSTANTFLIVSLYFVTYLPILIYDLTFSVNKQLRYTNVSEKVYAWVLSFTFINSCIDPFLYTLRNRQFKKAFLNLLRTALRQK